LGGKEKDHGEGTKWERGVESVVTKRGLNDEGEGKGLEERRAATKRAKGREEGKGKGSIK
jgi:hypothetical protein